MEVHVIAPPVLFVIGIIVIFISGGDKMFQTVGAVLVALVGIAFMKFTK